MCIEGNMNYYVAVFNSRSATLAFARKLKSKNIPCAIINTPSGITKACGISVKFFSEDYLKVEPLVGKNPSFFGFYSYFDNVRF